MIDEQGFRLNVGIILINAAGRLFWGRRPGNMNAWQFPQGGILENETIEAAMFRELEEELGLTPSDVRIIANTHEWVSYFLPEHFRRRPSNRPACIGQKQKWYLLELISEEKNIHFDRTSSPEFVEWLWVDHTLPAQQVIDFKKEVYEKVLKEFEPLLLEKISHSQGEDFQHK